MEISTIYFNFKFKVIRKRMQKLVGILVFSIPCFSVTISQENSLSEKPNILLIITDQLSGTALSCSGNQFVNTHSIDRLAASGIRFTENYVIQPLCLPFRSSFQTGRYPHEHGALSNQMDIKGSFPMLGKLVASSGYKCDYFGKWHVGTSPEKAGYVDYDNIGTDDKKAEAAVEYLLKEHEKPFFLTVSFMNPHNICELARADAIGTDLPDGSIGLPPKDLNKLPPLPENFKIGENEPSVIRQEQKGSNYEYPTASWNDTIWRQYLWGYYRLVEKVDSEIGSILNALKEGGYEENTIVIFTSDHGEGLAMHHWNQKKVFYDQVVRVPLIICWKGKTEKLVSHTLVSSALDVPATILDIVGVEIPVSRRGYSLLPFLEGNSPKLRQYIVAETMFNGKSNTEGATGRMLRTEKYKYCIYSEGENREQLFDMENDPGEMNNLANNKKFMKQMNKHRNLLSDWAQKTNDLEFPYYNQ